MKESKREWVNHNACRFCKGSRGHSCSGYDCREAVEAAGRYWNDKKAQEIRTLQTELDHRSGVEVHAIKLITERRYEDAMELLNTLK